MRYLKRLNKEVVENIFSLSAINIANTVLPLVTLPYVVATVGIDKYGIYSFAYAIIQYILLLSSYGFNLSATKIISQNRNDWYTISLVVSTIITCRFLLLVIIYVLLYVIGLCFKELYDVRFLIFYGIGIVVGDILNSVFFFQGIGKMRFITIVNFTSKIIFTLLIFVFINTSDDYELILIFNSFGYILAGVLAVFIMKYRLGVIFVFPTYKDIKYQFVDASHIFISTIGINLYRNSNVLLLGLLTNDYVVGCYSAAEKVIKGVQGVLSPITEALYPYLSMESSTRSKKDHIMNIFKISKKLSIFYVFLLITFYVVSPFAIKILFPIYLFDSIMNLLLMMGPIIVFGGLGYTYGILGLYVIDEKKRFMNIVFFSGIVSVFVLLMFVSIYPLLSGAISMLLAEITLCVLSFQSLKNKCNEV